LSEDLYGQPATEAAHGRHEMPETPPPDNTNEAIDRWAQGREADPANAPIDVVQYHERNPDGTTAVDADGNAKPYDPDAYISAERGAEDLAAWRASRLDELAEGEKQAVRDVADALRAEQPPAQQPTAQDESLKHQPQQQPVFTNDHQAKAQLEEGLRSLDQVLATTTDPDLVRGYQNQRAQIAQALQETGVRIAFAEHPHLASAVEQDIANRVAAQTAQVQAYQQQLAQQEAHIAQMAVAVFLNEPELRGLRQDQLATGLQILQRDNPQRHAEIMGRARAAGELVQAQQAAQAQAAQAQAEAQRAHFANWAHEQDLAFDKANPSVSQELKNEAMQMLRETGLKDSDIANLYNNAAWFRGAATQQVLRDAAEHRLSKRSFTEKRVTPKPVQMFGRSMERSDVAADADAPRLPSQFGNAKDAAKYLTALRARRG
jgi:hypothetical protein